MNGRSQTQKTGGGRTVLHFFLRFLGASIVLYLIYMWGGKYYAGLVARGAGPLLALFDHPIVIERALKVTEDISLNPIVFLSLVVAIEGVDIRTRLRAVLIGILVLTAANIVTVFLVFLSAYERNEGLWTGTEFVSLTINFFLPLLLWFVLMPIRSIMLFREKE